MTELPNRIREWRHARGLTLTDLAERTDCSFVMLSQLERGKRKLTDEWMRRLGSALAVPMGQMLPWQENPHSLTPEEWFLVERFRAGSPKQQDKVLRIAEIICEPN